MKKKRVRKERAWLILSHSDKPMWVELNYANAEYEGRLLSAKEVRKCWITYSLPRTPKRRGGK